MSVSDRVSSQAALLASVSYEPVAADLIRYRVETSDDAVASVVRSVVAEGVDGVAAFGDATTRNEVDTLRLFAMRRVTLGRRQSSLGPFYEALDAFGLLRSALDVPWETWVKGALFFSRSIGGDLESMQERLLDLRPDFAERSNVAFGAMDRVQEISQCLLEETSTQYGVGLFETLVVRSARASRLPHPGWGTSLWGMFGAPIQGDNYVAYAPTTNLATLTASLADAMDHSTHVTTGPLGQDQLADIQFSLATSGSYLPTRGCLSFVATNARGAAMTVFVAEVPERDDDDDDTLDATDLAASLAQSASELEGQLALSSGSRLILLAAQPSFTDDDVEINVHEYEELARSALSEATPN